MKKVYLIHGWAENDSSEKWFGWLRDSCEKEGIKFISFNMPNSHAPKIEEWVHYLKENIPVEDLDEHTYFVGHSVGCQTIMRYLEKLPKTKRIAGCVFVAGWFDLINLEPEELEIAHPWTNTEINFERILEHCDRFLALFSDNDPYVHSDESKKFEKDLGAKIIFKHGDGHFTSADGVIEIPEILSFIK